MTVLSSMQCDETVSEFFARLTEAYDTHSGHVAPEGGLVQGETLPYENHLKDYFLNRVKPEIAETVKTSCIERTTWLKNIVQHAEHTEEVLKRKLYTAQLVMYAALSGSARCRRYRGGDCGGRGPRKRTCSQYDPEACFSCRNKGHCAKECPDKRAEGVATN